MSWIACPTHPVDMHILDKYLATEPPSGHPGKEDASAPMPPLDAGDGCAELPPATSSLPGRIWKYMATTATLWPVSSMLGSARSKKKKAPADDEASGKPLGAGNFEVRVEEEVSASSDAVWAIFTDWRGEANTAITNATFGVQVDTDSIQGAGEGMRRTLEASGGVRFVEAVASCDGEARRLVYTFPEGTPFKMERAFGVIEVLPPGEGASSNGNDATCRVRWTGYMDLLGAASILPGFMTRAVVGNLYRKFIRGVEREAAQ